MAGSFQDAFINAGIVSQADIDRKEKEKKEEEQRKKDREIIRQQVEDMQKQDALNHKRERKPPENPFDRIWRQSRNLIVHLIHAYSPAIGKGHIAFFSVELKTQTCSICHCKLISKEDLFGKIPELAEISLNHLHDLVQGTLTPKKITTDFSKVTGGAVIGIVSEDSKTALCPACYRDFISWVETAIVSGNPHVNRIIRKLRTEKAACSIPGSENEQVSTTHN